MSSTIVVAWLKHQFETTDVGAAMQVVKIDKARGVIWHSYIKFYY
jgi:hypothetical protein